MHIQRMQRAALLLMLLVLLLSLSLTMGVAQAQEIVRVGGQVDWSPDGKLVAVANGRGLTLFDANLQPASPSMKNVSGVLNFSWSSDSHYIVTVHYDAIARIWDAQTGQIIRTLEGHTDRLIGAAWGLDDKQIATTSSDQTIRIWDVATGKTVRTINLVNPKSGMGPYPASMVWDAKYNMIAMASQSQVFFWSTDPKNGRSLAEFENKFGGTALFWRSPGYIMVNGIIVTDKVFHSSTVLIFPSPLDPPPCTTAPSAATWSYDAAYVVYAGVEADSKIVCVIDVSQMTTTRPKQVMVVRVQDNSFRQFGSVSINPEGKTVVALSDDDETLYMWETATGKQLKLLKLDAPMPTPSASPTR